MRKAFVISVAAVLCFAGSVMGAETASISGRFVYDGKAPTPEKLSVSKDPDVCGKPPALVDESLMVGKDGGMANVIIWVRTKNVPVGPDVKEPAGKAVIDNKHCRFEPHVVLAVVGKPLELENSDPIAHNTKADLQANTAFNNQIPANTKQDLKPLGATEATPVSISCNIHPWMKGVLAVLPNPFGAVSDSDGKFEIKGLPVGTELEFQVWQEKSGNVEKASVAGKSEDWKRGRFKKTLKAGANDLGDIKLEAGQFKK